MTLEEESRLSFYRELTVLDEKKNIVLVQDIRNSELCVKKTIDIYTLGCCFIVKNRRIF